MRRSLLPLALTGLLGLTLLPGTASAAHGTLTITGLTAGDSLVEFTANAPADVLREVPITGVVGDVQSIDFRPADGRLYALAVAADGGRLYTVDTASGAATAVPAAPLIPVEGRVSIDWNPAANALRIVTAAGDNLRLTSALVLVEDGDLAYVAGDRNEGERPVIGGIAYTNSVPGPRPATTVLYDVDAAVGALAKQDPPNAGGLQTVAADLPQRTKAQATGFDIYSRTNGSGTQWAFVSLFEKGRSTLYEIDLATGKAKPSGSDLDPASGTVIGSTPHVTDIAVRPAQGL